MPYNYISMADVWCSKLVNLLENCEVIWWKRHCVDHKRAAYNVIGPSNHPYTSKERDDTLKQQLMSAIMTHNHSSKVELDPKIG